MADRNGYIGRAPGDSTVTVARQTFTPTGVTTDFTFTSGYNPGYIDAYLNGVRLIYGTDYTAGDGSVVGLTSAAQSGDILELVAYKAFNAATVDTALSNFTVNNKLTVTGISSLTDVVSSGIVTADSFSGGWSGALSVTDTTASTSTSTGALIVSGGVGIAKSLFVGEGISVAGTITYNDVTNVDSIGIITAGKGLRATTGGLVVTAGNVKVTAGIASIGAGVTISSDFIHLTDNSKINLGIASDLKIYHDGTNSFVDSNTGSLKIQSGAGAYVEATEFKIYDEAASETVAEFVADGACNLYYDNSKKLATTGGGIDVTGHTETDTLKATGIGTFKGDVELHGNQGVSSVTWDASANSLLFKDSSYAKFGTGGDLEIYHDGSNSHISDQGSGVVYLRTNNLQVNNAANNEAMISATDNGSVDLYYDNSRKFQTVGTGVSVYGDLKLQNGLLRENVNIVAGKLSANLTINTDNGMVHYFTTQESAQSIPNIISGAGINTDMAIGDTMTISVLTTAHATSFPTNWRIDGVEASAGVTTYWNGGSAPSAGADSGVDFYTINFVKTASARYTAFANVSNFA